MVLEVKSEKVKQGNDYLMKSEKVKQCNNTWCGQQWQVNSLADSRGVKMTGKHRNLRGETVRPTMVWTLFPVCRKSIGDEESIAGKVSCCCDGGTNPGTSPEKIMQTKDFSGCLILPALVVRQWTWGGGDEVLSEGAGSSLEEVLERMRCGNWSASLVEAEYNRQVLVMLL